MSCCQHLVSKMTTNHMDSINSAEQLSISSNHLIGQ